MEDRNRRLLFVSGSAHRLGGLATWLDHTLPGLKGLGWEPVLGLVEGPRHHRPTAYLAAHPQKAFTRIRCMTGTPEGRRKALIGTLRRLDPGIVVGVNIPDVYPAAAELRSRGSGVRAVLALHGILPELYDDVSRFGKILDAVVATNRLAGDLASEIGNMDPGRVFYAPCGVDVPATLPAREGHRPFRIGYAGRLEQRQKRVTELPKISCRLDEMGVDHEFMIAGEGPRRSELQRRFPPNRAVFVGTLPREEMGERFYGEIDCLLITSAWETGPLVAWEAMAAGLPVVSTRFVGWAREGALRHGETALLYEAGEIGEAARNIVRVRDEDGLAERLRVGGFELVRRSYARTSSVRAWSEALEAVSELPRRETDPEWEIPRSTGRLDRWLSPRRAEWVRAVMGRWGPDAGPGGEWPHTYGRAGALEEFLDLARVREES